MKTLIPSALMLAALTFAPATVSAACWSTSSPEYDTGVATGISLTGGNGRYYADNDVCQAFWGGVGDQCLASTWVYEESNGLPGLQRDDDIVSDVRGCGVRGDNIVV